MRGCFVRLLGTALALLVAACGGTLSPSLRPARDDGVLVLFDDTGDYAQLDELYATGVGILVSHFGRWRLAPISGYKQGDLSASRAAVYLGSHYNAPIPSAFLDDVLHGNTPVMWIDSNIWQLAQRKPDFASRYGFMPDRFDDTPVHHVIFKGVHLDRHTDNASPIMKIRGLDPRVATVLAWAESTDGRQSPWAVRSRNLLYIGENPLVYIEASDRYLAFCDLLFELLAPDTPERHRALLRIEDVHPLTPPKLLRDIADYLHQAHVPFAVAVIPVFVDPKGAEHSGQPTRRTLSESPETIAALKYMVERGGTLVLHGYSHQHEDAANPYNGVTGDDFEFFQAHIDSHNNVIQTGPVPEDSAQWALARIDKAFTEFDAAGLPRPRVFEYPHYAGSVVDSQALAKRFDVAYHRGTYFAHTQDGAPDYKRSINLFFPFVVQDIFGWKVLPENIGNYIPVGYNNHASRGIKDMVRIAEVNQVVRDGFASMFYHPFLGVELLREIVPKIQGAGYEFVGIDSL